MKNCYLQPFQTRIVPQYKLTPLGGIKYTNTSLKNLMKTINQRLNIVIGQLSGVCKMIDQKKDASEVLNQLKATKAGIENVIQKFSEQQLLDCIGLCKNDRDICRDFIKEIVKNS